MLEDYALLGAFLLLGALLGAVPLVLPLLISPRYKGEESGQAYECGVDTIGPTWIRFNIAFYIFALIFVAFEVDILYLFPIALVYEDFGWRGFAEVAIFVTVLSMAILYAWRKGVFRWEA